MAAEKGTYKTSEAFGGIRPGKPLDEILVSMRERHLCFFPLGFCITELSSYHPSDAALDRSHRKYAITQIAHW